MIEDIIWSRSRSRSRNWNRYSNSIIIIIIIFTNFFFKFFTVYFISNINFWFIINEIIIYIIWAFSGNWFLKWKFIYFKIFIYFFVKFFFLKRNICWFKGMLKEYIYSIWIFFFFFAIRWNMTLLEIYKF